MAFFNIPIPSTIIPFDLQIELDGELFLLKFVYQHRTGHWAMTIVRAGVVVLSNIKVVNTDDLLKQYDHLEDLPIGTIIISDQDLVDSDPDDINFGDRVLFMYQDTA